jgi:hypothetical protein
MSTVDENPPKYPVYISTLISTLNVFKLMGILPLRLTDIWKFSMVIVAPGEWPKYGTCNIRPSGAIE